MAEQDSIREKVQRLVDAVLESHTAAIGAKLTEQIVREISTASSGQGSSGASVTGLLKGAITSIHGAGTQTEILRALLDGSAGFCERAGLLVVRFNSAQGWQSRGFQDEQGFRALTVECGRGLGHRVLESHEPAAGTVSDLDPTFVEKFGAPHDGNVVLVPLVIKGKVAAMLYADAGSNGELDGDAIELLVQSAGMWLEVQTLRRAAGIPIPPAYVREEAVHETPVPVGSHAPVAVPASVEASAAPAVHAEPIAPSKGSGEGNSPTAPEDEVVNTKARRFAKLLVDEIKLYNQAKVAEGREARDLYSRLKDDIDKSRATYQRRYGHVNNVDYFRQELVRVLADNDASLLGTSFQ